MNIFVVEDESEALTELASLLNCYLPQHRLFTFADGDEALEQFQTVRPDLVITDIRMPGTDGLTMLGLMKQHQPQLQAIVLSGYNDFDYARRGLKIGVKDYLLKPIKAEQLYATLDKVLIELLQVRQQSQRLAEWELAKLLNSPGGDNSFTSFNFKGCWGLVIMLLENWESPTSWYEIAPSVEQVYAELKNVLGGEVYDLTLDAHRRVILYPLMSSQSTKSLEEVAIRLHRTINHTGILVHTSFNIKTTNEPLEVAFRQAQNVLEQYLCVETPTFLTRGLAPLQEAVVNVWEKSKLLELYMLNSDVARLRQEIEALLAELKSSRVTLKQLTVFVINLLFALQNSSGSDKKLLEKEDVNSYLRSVTSYQQVGRWLEEHLVSRISGGAVATPKQLIFAIIELINSSYDQDVSLQSFATRHNVSLGYLSRLFKVHTGSNFSDYLIKVRMQKAEELLSRGGMRTCEVGVLVGYEDPKYFSHLFKKTTGFSPQDYLNNRKTNLPKKAN